MLAVVLLAVGFFWVRDSSFVAVEQVKIGGLPEGTRPVVKRAIIRTAESMTTMHIDNDAFARLAAQYPEIKAIKADGSLLHELKVTVVPNTPVAIASISGRQTVVAADGALIAGLRPSAQPLPTVKLTNRSTAGGKVTSVQAIAMIKLMATAPADMRRRAKSVFIGDRGLTVVMSSGTKIYFGNGSDPKLQWLVASRLLAEPSLKSATSIDVSSPRRPAVAGAGQPLPGAESADPEDVADPIAIDGATTQQEDTAAATPPAGADQSEAGAPTAEAQAPAVQPTPESQGQQQGPPQTGGVGQ